MKMSRRKINFNAGPSVLPEYVLEATADAVKEYDGTGYSILELPHRSEAFLQILDESRHLVKDLCNLNSDFEILWMHGGGRMQFSLLPMNFLTPGTTAAYADSGHWAAEAMEYARYFGNVSITGSSASTKYDRLPEWPSNYPNDSTYLHFTTNNTIYGTQYADLPVSAPPLVADMSSDIFSLYRNYQQFAMFYAAAQKNLGTSGVALVAIDKAFLASAKNVLPPMLSYKAHARAHSNLNTANVSGIYVALLMLRWTKARGLVNIEKENTQKASLLYEALDASTIFKPHVHVKEHRSIMNVCFTVGDGGIEKKFLDFCEQNDILGIQGHRSVGGFRVSLYNAVPMEHVRTLVEIMKEFERIH